MHEWMVVRRSALLALVLLVPLACDPGDSPTDPPAETGEPAMLELSADSLAFTALGDSARLTAVVRDGDGNEVADPAVTWASLDGGVAAVDTAGGVTAVAAGVTRIVASAGAAADTALVAVQQVMATFEVSPAADSLGEGDTLRIAVLVADSNGVAIEGAAIEWESGDEAVATVDGAGLVTAVREGGTVVTARAGGLSRTVTITVLGKIAFLSRRNGIPVQIHVMNTDGSGITRITDQAQPGLFAWSPDGSRIAFVSFRNGNDEIYTVAADGSGLTRITNDPSRDIEPAWSPDGTRIVFVSLRNGNAELYTAAADGSGLTRITNDPSGADDPAWSPDGTRIAFMRVDDDEEIYVAPADGGGQPVNVTVDVEGRSYAPAWSPDGTRIAFINITDGPGGVDNYEVYVIAADGSGEPTNLSNSAAASEGDPVWSPDGSRIAFTSDRAGSMEIYVVDVDSDDLLRLTHNLNVSDGAPSWSPDGDRLTFSRSLPDLTGDIYVINADGSGETRLTDHPALDANAVWRPRP